MVVTQAWNARKVKLSFFYAFIFFSHFHKFLGLFGINLFLEVFISTLISCILLMHQLWRILPILLWSFFSLCFFLILYFFTSFYLEFFTLFLLGEESHCFLPFLIFFFLKKGSVQKLFNTRNPKKVLFLQYLTKTSFFISEFLQYLNKTSFFISKSKPFAVYEIEKLNSEQYIA